MAQKSNSTTLLSVAEEIFGQTYLLTKQLREKGIAEPSLAVGASTELWSSHAGEIEKAQTEIFGLTKKLTKLLHGPHGFLHEYVSSNWEYGALYTLLEFDILEKIPVGETVHVSQLAEQSGLPLRKLLSILRLAACEDILEETTQGDFGHTAISEELVKDPGYKAFIGFQLFETRVASAHLADSLKKPNDFWSGQSAFKYAWGAPMYDWHRTHPEKGKRFGMAMESVTKSLDPGNKLLSDYFKEKDSPGQDLIVDISGKAGSTSKFLAEEFPKLKFQVQDVSQPLLDQGRQSLPETLKERIAFEQHDLFKPQETQNQEKILAYIIKSVLWNLCDDDCIKVLQTFIPALEKFPETVILVNDLVSPRSGTFEPHVEKAYRRRDVTLMTMHNVKQRTEQEWLDLLRSVSPHFQVNFTQAFTSHSCRGLWEIRWVPAN